MMYFIQAKYLHKADTAIEWLRESVYWNKKNICFGTSNDFDELPFVHVDYVTISTAHKQSDTLNEVLLKILPK